MSIPLPALGVNPPQQQPSPIDQYSKAIALQSLMQGQQLQRQEIQLKQQQLTDQQAMTAAMKDADPSSPTFYDDVSRGILKNGGSAQASLAVAQHALTIRKTASDIAASDAATGSEKSTYGHRQA